jgi:hypothetical protein
METYFLPEAHQRRKHKSGERQACQKHAAPAPWTHLACSCVPPASASLILICACPEYVPLQAKRADGRRQRIHSQDLSRVHAHRWCRALAAKCAGWGWAGSTALVRPLQSLNTSLPVYLYLFDTTTVTAINSCELFNTSLPLCLSTCWAQL